MATSYVVKYLTELDIDHQNLSREIEQFLVGFNKVFSTYDPDSEISTINRSSNKKEGILVSKEFYDQLNQAIKISFKTGKTFDPTVSDLVNLWGFGWKKNYGHSNFQLPSKEAVKQALLSVGIEKIILDGGLLKMPEEMELDFSAIAKGRAVDEIGKILEKKNIKNYLVEIGGEVSTSGFKSLESHSSKPSDTWKILVASPGERDKELTLVVDLKGKAMATSGDYHHFYEKEGQRYSHMIDPRTGSPVDHRLASVSVIAESCEEADGLSTALMVMGEVEGREFIEKHDLDAFMIYRAEGERNGLKTFISKGFRSHILP